MLDFTIKIQQYILYTVLKSNLIKIQFAHNVLCMKNRASGTFFLFENKIAFVLIIGIESKLLAMRNFKKQTSVAATKAISRFSYYID